ncbi:MAG: hypothetical protein PHV37_08005 [Candidatus Gastranaerophilales bacterium]|nr:hypothetical protein [Candidatus Gastranaerophilales bacterium]
MGKSKRRIFNKNKNTIDLTMHREDAIEIVSSEINENRLSEEAKNLISLFGISAEELAESGVTYEDLRSLDFIL